MNAHPSFKPKKTRGRPFEKGNPGRPPGAKNKSTVLQSRLDDAGDEIFDKLIEMALEGDSTALRICASHLLVPKTERFLPDLEIPKIETPADLPEALSTVAAAVAGGTITLSEGAAVADLLERNARAFGDRDAEARLVALEAKLQLFKDL